MRHRQLSIALFVLTLLTCLAGGADKLSAAETTGKWDIPSEIRRLYKEAPSIAAYPDVKGVVWLNSFKYDLASDGTMQKSHRFLMLCGQHRPGEDMSQTFPLPQEGASFVVTEAAWYNPMTGMKEGSLPARRISENGFDRILIEFPKETEGRVIALATQETHARQLSLDDALFLADAYPIWEQIVTLEIPDGMDLYWQGEGVREPSKRKSAGKEIITWTLMNQQIWQGTGIVDVKRPALVFSLRKGLSPYLRSIQEEVLSRFQAPPLPADLNLQDKGNLIKAGETIAAYVSKKNLAIPGYTPQLMKTRSPIPTSGPWTPWEQTLIAGKWLENLGYSVDYYWNQKIPVPEDGPGVLNAWVEPVLVIKSTGNKEKDIYYKAGQVVEFGKTPPSLCGATIYRQSGSIVEKRTIPRGNASEHTLGQTWKLILDEKGIATGTLEITATGAWVNVLGYGRTPSTEDLVDSISQHFIFNAPGLSLTSPSVKPLDSGYRIAFAVRAASGIVSGNGILMRVPTAVPKNLEEISGAGEKYAIRFPFTLEQNINIATPKGYRVVGTPPVEKQGDSKALLEESMIHWPKRGQLEAVGKWTVRVQDMDETLSKVVLSELNSYIRWSQTTLPLRKQ